MYFMLTATYKGPDDVVDIYKHTKDRHPKLPNGVEHIDTWVGTNGRRHFQVLKTDDESLLKRWTTQLDDLFDIEIDHVLHGPSTEMHDDSHNMS